MALKEISFGSTEYRKMVQLRYEILRKPLGLEFSEEELAKEKNDILIAAFEDDYILGCCILSRLDLETVRLRQMAVQNNQQGKGVGASLMMLAENLARDRGFRKLVMHARKAALGFYEKQGYRVEGDEFTEVSIPHFRMYKMLK